MHSLEIPRNILETALSIDHDAVSTMLLIFCGDKPVKPNDFLSPPTVLRLALYDRIISENNYGNHATIRALKTFGPHLDTIARNFHPGIQQISTFNILDDRFVSCHTLGSDTAGALFFDCFQEMMLKELPFHPLRGVSYNLNVLMLRLLTKIKQRSPGADIKLDTAPGSTKES